MMSIISEKFSVETNLTRRNSDVDYNDDVIAYDVIDWRLRNDTVTSTSPNVTETETRLDVGGGGVMTLTVVIVTIYGLICAAGLVGNALVIFVVARDTRMKTVTNVYITNLSLTDGLFLVGLPMIMKTTIAKSWMFGALMCKVYYVLTCVNMFTGAFTLTLMSADRFAAVWYPIKSLKYRRPALAGVAAATTWLFSIAVMFPIVLYADTVPKSPESTLYRCVVQWPAAHALTAGRIYILYTMTVGFVVPVTLISVFYGLLVSRLRANRHHIRAAAERRRPTNRRNVTGLVTLVIGVFFVCWLPYWSFQLYLIFGQFSHLPVWKIYLFNFLTIMTYANSAVNPLLYAYTNDNFKKAFAAIFRCRTPADSTSGSGGGQPLRPTTQSNTDRPSDAAGTRASRPGGRFFECCPKGEGAGRGWRRRRKQSGSFRSRKNLAVEYEFSVLRTSVVVSSTEAAAGEQGPRRLSSRAAAFFKAMKGQREEEEGDDDEE